MRSIDAARRAGYLQICQEAIEILDLQLGKGNVMFFKVGMERGQKAFDLSEVVERSFVRLLMEIGLKRIGQQDLSPWDSQRPGNPAVDGKIAGQCDEGTGCALEGTKLTERLECVEGKHIFPDYIFGYGEPKKVHQDEGVPFEGPTGVIGLHGLFPCKIIYDGLR